MTTSTTTTPLKIIFAGTPEFAATALDALLKTDHEIIAIYSQPDRPAGRGRKLLMSPVKQLAVEHGIPVYQPSSLKDEQAQAELAALKADLMIVAAYGLLLPETILTMPRYGCLNIHASLLPRWRGAAPIQHAILAGDNETGITIMQMDKGLDTGAMLYKQSIPITSTTTGGELHDALATLGAECITHVLTDLQNGKLNPVAQDNSQACYAHKIEKSHAQINWHNSAMEIDRLVRAYNPWPVAYTQLDEKNIRVWHANISDTAGSNVSGNKAPGTILSVSNEGIQVQCKNSILLLTELQLPNARRMNVRDILNGHADLFSVGKSFTDNNLTGT